MEEITRQLVGYLRGMWRYRWWGLVGAWLVGAGAATMVMLMPDRYESSARIYVDTKSVLMPLMRGLAVQPAVEQQVAILSRTLISRPNVEKLIRMADLDLTIKTDGERQRLIERLMGTLEIRSTGRDSLYTLAYSDTDPTVAKRVVQSLVSIFVESGLGDKRKDADSARRFIEDQIAVYQRKLEEAENRLKEFKLANMAFIGDGKQDYFGQMIAEDEQLKQAVLQLHEAEQSRDSIKKQLEDEALTAVPQQSMPALGMTPELDARIDALERDLDAMLQRFTELHPDVVGARRVLADLKSERARELKRLEKEALDNPLSAPVNPIVQQLKLSLGAAEAQVASLRARVAAYRARYEELKASSEMVPKIEAEFTQMNRDYQIHKQNYDSLVARRESASMSSELESTSGMAEFRVIDPPSQPLKPAAPNRILLMPAAGALALAAGLAVAFLLSQIRPTFQDARGLREVTGLPLLGTVSMVPNEKRTGKQRRMLFAFVGGFTTLVGCFTALTVLVAVMRVN